MQTPAPWRDAISNLLHGVARSALTNRAERISALYRDGESSGLAIRDEADALAYALTRSPATYGAVHNVLQRLRERAPHFAPATALDLGAGAGAASWAIADHWPGIHSIAQYDNNKPLLQLGKQIAQNAPAPALQNALQCTGDLTRAEHLPSADLVVISYMLAELQPAQMDCVVAHAWQQTGAALALIEPGTPAGYRRILRARDLLLARQARILAPCPHQQPCPLTPPDWCHFAQRIERSRDHRLLKGADLPYEDEKFSYLIAVRESLFSPAAQGRILARPERDPNLIHIKLCAADGKLQQRRISRRDKDQYKRARKTEWGEEL
ncbi:MAG: small ribosomal subunit Rsm22 family protein [Acidobacteriota bacterium]